jgi:hypothetical protein
MILPENILSKMSPADRKKIGKAGVTSEEAALKQIVKSEGELQKLINNELNRREIWFAWSRMNKRTTSKIGTPDFLFSYKGKFCAVEAKHEKREPTKEQRDAIRSIQRNGGTVAVIRTFQGFLDFLRTLD